MKHLAAYSLVLMCWTLLIPCSFGQEIAPSSSPDDLTSVGDKLFFSAEDGVHGRELWMYTEQVQEPTLVLDVWPGEHGSNPSNFCALGDKLLFAAEAQDESKPGFSLGSELWISDGTADGTQLVLDIYPGLTPGFRKWLTAHNGIAYFEAEQPDTGKELWRTDGTKNGTRIIQDLWPGEDGAEPTRRDFGWLPDGRLVFVGFRDAETVLFVLNPGDETIQPLKVLEIEANVLRAALGVVFFTTQDTERGRELWKTDGSEAGTVFVKDINPGASDANPESVIQHGDKAYFAAADAEHGRELWVTDGTENGTHMIKDVNPGAADSKPHQLISGGNYLYFAGAGESIGVEIWRTDGTDEGTILLRDINTGQANSNPYSPVSLGDGIVFGAASTEDGVELWGSDGTSAGTRLVKDIIRGPSAETSGNPYRLARHGARVYFHATTLENGVELWRTDGTTDGTTLVYDICREIRPNPASSPHNLTAVNDTLFFVARDPDHGNELWRTTDGPAKVQMVKDIFPGSAGSDPDQLTAVDSLLYFSADDGTNGNELWRSDGTEGGTRLVEDYATTQANSAPKELTVFKNTLYFVGWTEKGGEELLMVKDMVIHRVKDINPGPASSSPRELAVVGDALYFRANDGTHGDELWASWGSEYNTQMVHDILPRTTASTIPTWLTPVEHRLFFVASDGMRGLELWSIEAAGGRPSMVADIAHGSAISLLGNESDRRGSGTR